MELKIRNIDSRELGSVVALVREFAAFEKLSEYCEITPEKLANALFGENACLEGLIALDGDLPIGYAFFYPNFSSFRGQQGLYLEDIYVSEKYRGHGVGDKMLRQIARTGKKRGFERIDFMVLDWNTAAIDFYFHLGAVRNDGEQHFKFDSDAFEKLAREEFRL